VNRAREPRVTWPSAVLEPDSGPSWRGRLAAAVSCELANGAGVLDPAPSMPTVAARLGVALSSAHEGRQELEQAGTPQLLRAVARPGDTICDPCLGSGTTAVASLAEGCDFVACDVDAEAIETTRRRLEA
jgi:methylase of polypeptide subunit release factors